MKYWELSGLQPSLLAYIYRAAEKISRKLLFIMLPNIWPIFKIFHRHILWKLCNKVVTKYTTTTLTASLHHPCEIQIFKNHYNDNKYVCNTYVGRVEVAEWSSYLSFYCSSLHALLPLAPQHRSHLRRKFYHQRECYVKRSVLITDNTTTISYRSILTLLLYFWYNFSDVGQVAFSKLLHVMSMSLFSQWLMYYFGPIRYPLKRGAKTIFTIFGAIVLKECTGIPQYEG